MSSKGHGSVLKTLAYTSNDESFSHHVTVGLSYGSQNGGNVGRDVCSDLKHNVPTTLTEAIQGKSQ